MLSKLTLVPHQPPCCWPAWRRCSRHRTATSSSPRRHTTPSLSGCRLSCSAGRRLLPPRWRWRRSCPVPSPRSSVHGRNVAPEDQRRNSSSRRGFLSSDSDCPGNKGGRIIEIVLREMSCSYGSLKLDRRRKDNYLQVFNSWFVYPDSINSG